MEEDIVPAGPGESRFKSASQTYNREVTPFLLNRVILAFCWLGFFVAGVLSISSLTGLTVPCGTSMGCEIVAAHPTSKLWGVVPVSYLGLFGYAALAVLALLRAQASGTKWNKLSMIGLVLSGIGAGYSIYLTYVSFAIIGARCMWCLSSAGTMILLFLLHGWMHQSATPSEPGSAKLDWLIGGTGLLVALGLIGVQMQGMKEAIDRGAANVSFSTVTEKDIIPDESKLKGPADAKVTIVEFADINCPACRRSAPMLKEIIAQHNGKLRVGYRHIPLHMLQGHETSIEAAMIAEYAATQGKFWDFVDAAFDASNDNRVKTVNGLLNIAGDIGLDREEARKKIVDMDDTLLDRVNADMVLGTQSMTIYSTPTFVVLADGLEPKAFSVQRLKEALEQEPYASLLK